MWGAFQTNFLNISASLWLLPFSPAWHLCRPAFRESSGKFWRQKRDCGTLVVPGFVDCCSSLRVNYLSGILWKFIKISIAFQFYFSGGVGWMSVRMWDHVKTRFQPRLCFLVGTVRKQEPRFACFILFNDGSFDLLVFCLWLLGRSVERFLSDYRVVSVDSTWHSWLFVLSWSLLTQRTQDYQYTLFFIFSSGMVSRITTHLHHIYIYFVCVLCVCFHHRHSLLWTCLGPCLLQKLQHLWNLKLYIIFDLPSTLAQEPPLQDICLSANPVGPPFKAHSQPGNSSPFSLLTCGLRPPSSLVYTNWSPYSCSHFQ